MAHCESGGKIILLTSEGAIPNKRRGWDFVLQVCGHVLGCKQRIVVHDQFIQLPHLQYTGWKSLYLVCVGYELLGGKRQWTDGVWQWGLIPTERGRGAAGQALDGECQCQWDLQPKL